MKKIYSVLLCLPLFLFNGCGGDSGTDVVLKDVASITIDPGVYEIAATDALELNCTVNYNDGSSATATDYVTWTASDYDLVKTTTGIASRAGSAGGEVNVSATYEVFSDYVTVNVHRLSAMAIDINDTLFEVNSTYLLNVDGIFTDTLTDTNATHDVTLKVAWTLSDTSLATLEQNGTLTTSDQNGTLQIKAELYETNATIDLNITL